MQKSELVNSTSADKKKQDKKEHVSEAGGQNCISYLHASPGGRSTVSSLGADSWSSPGRGDDSSEEETSVPVQNQILDRVAGASSSGSSKDKKNAKLSRSSVCVKKNIPVNRVNG